MDGTGVGIAPGPPSAQSTVYQIVLTPSRAKNGPGGRFDFGKMGSR